MENCYEWDDKITYMSKIGLLLVQNLAVFLFRGALFSTSKRLWWIKSDLIVLILFWDLLYCWRGYCYLVYLPLLCKFEKDLLFLLVDAAHTKTHILVSRTWAGFQSHSHPQLGRPGAVLGAMSSLSLAGGWVLLGIQVHHTSRSLTDALSAWIYPSVTPEVTCSFTFLYKSNLLTSSFFPLCLRTF